MKRQTAMYVENRPHRQGGNNVLRASTAFSDLLWVLGLSFNLKGKTLKDVLSKPRLDIVTKYYRLITSRTCLTSRPFL